MGAPERARGELLVATRNPGKLRELGVIASEWGLRPVTLSDVGLDPSPLEDLLEEQPTFTANALAKARHFYARSGGRATVADDSGLEVDTLSGAPGVRSRRWAGATGTQAEVDAANNATLLHVLGTRADRAARFVCAVAYVDPHGELIRQGELTGRIAHAPRGTAGFGYDAVFEVGELQWRTLAEVGADEKQRVSHRNRAFTALAEALQDRSRAGTAR